MPSVRRFIWFGLALVGVSAHGVIEALDARRAGVKVQIPHSPDLEWWAAGGMSGLGIILGLYAIGIGLGWIKTKGERPM